MGEVLSEPLVAKAQGTTVTFDGRTVSIRRNLLSPQGRGSRSIPVSQIAGVDVRPPALPGASGSFSLVLPGTLDRRKGWSARRDEKRNENTVLFHGNGSRRQFEQLRDAILAAL